MTPDTEELARRIGDALQKCIPEELVTRWIVLLETVETDTGERGLWTLSGGPGEIMAWDTKGMLQHALDIQTAQTMRDGD